jgi:hypothetical protein
LQKLSGAVAEATAKSLPCSCESGLPLLDQVQPVPCCLIHSELISELILELDLKLNRPITLNSSIPEFRTISEAISEALPGNECRAFCKSSHGSDAVSNIIIVPQPAILPSPAIATPGFEHGRRRAHCQPALILLS